LKDATLGRSWSPGGVSRFVAVGIMAVAVFAHWPTPREVWPRMETLACTLQLLPTGGSEIALAFEVRNAGGRPVTARYFRPYLDFELTATAADGPVPIVQPIHDTGLYPVEVTIEPGKTAHIETPIRLRFDPDVPPSGGDVPTVWTLRHAPVPVVLRAILRLDGATVGPCEAKWQPT
jgi:hypothetical protein